MSDLFDYDDLPEQTGDILAGVLEYRGQHYYAIERNASFRMLLHSTWYSLELEFSELNRLVDLFPLPIPERTHL